MMIRPADAINPMVVAVMHETQIDLSNAQPQRLTPEMAEQAGLLVTMGCGEQCPVVPGVRREDWPLDDPHLRPLREVRIIRDEIRRRVTQLIAAEGWK
jgi:arsenate reductase